MMMFNKDVRESFSSISVGDKGSRVSDVQERLLNLGISPKGLAGEIEAAVFGNATLEAVLEFQKSRRIRVTGFADDDTWNDLVEASYSLGDRFLYLQMPPIRGDDVFELQRTLNSLGIYAGPENGIYGRATDSAVKRFQRQVGCHSDGIVGTSTVEEIRRLKRMLNKPGIAQIKELTAYRPSMKSLSENRALIDAFCSFIRENPLDYLARYMEKTFDAESVSCTCAPKGVPERERAHYANRIKASVSISLTADDCPHYRELNRDFCCFYFASTNYYSPLGERLASIISEHLESCGIKGDPVSGRRFPILRDSLMPSASVVLSRDVLLEMNDSSPSLRDISSALSRSLKKFFLSV